jgi:hypothetical protein
VGVVVDAGSEFETEPSVPVVVSPVVVPALLPVGVCGAPVVLVVPTAPVSAVPVESPHAPDSAAVPADSRRAKSMLRIVISSIRASG